MVKLALTEILGSLLNDLSLALSADLQHGLLTRITLMDNFLPNVADAMGIIAPTVFAHKFGQASPFEILLSEKVNKTLKEIKACTDAYKASIEKVVLTRAHKEAICHAKFFRLSFAQRTNDTIENDDWKTMALLDLRSWPAKEGKSKDDSTNVIS